MIVRFRGCQSQEKWIPGSAPQGTLIGVFLYILYINPISFPGEVTLQIHDVLTSYWEEYNIPSPVETQNYNLHLPETMNSAKFMDDVTCQEVIDINTALASNIDRSGPLPFWESSGKILPPENSLLQKEITHIKEISDRREMKLNPKKTFLFIANFSLIHQFKPMLRIPGEQDFLEVVQEVKLLGFWFTSDMKAHKHVQYLLAIVNKRIWAISKLKRAGVCDEDLKYFFTMKLRSVLESLAPVFHSLLTQEDSKNIERIQKTVTRIIMGSRYSSYEESLVYLDLESLEIRRENLCLAFALKCLKTEKFKHLFQATPDLEYAMRNDRRKVIEPQCNLLSLNVTLKDTSHRH